MLRSARTVLLWSGGVAVVASTTVISYRNAALYYHARILECDRKALDEQLQVNTIDNDIAIDESRKRIIEEQMKMDGLQRLWTDRFRRYANGLAIFHAAGEYFPTLVRRIDDTVEMIRDATNQLKISDEYEFASSKIHMLALLLNSTGWLHHNFSTKSTRVTWQESPEQELTRSLFRGDPLVQLICASYDLSDVSLFFSKLNRNGKTECEINTLNHELNAILRSMREVLPLTIKAGRSRSNDTGTSHDTVSLRLRDVSLMGSIAEETFRQLLRVTDYIPVEKSQNQPDIETCDFRKAFSVRRFQQAKPHVQLSSLDHVVEAIYRMEKLFADADIRHVLPEEHARTQKWIAAAESLVIREMGFTGLKAFHTCLTHSMVLRK